MDLELPAGRRRDHHPLCVPMATAGRLSFTTATPNPTISALCADRLGQRRPSYEAQVVAVNAQGNSTSFKLSELEVRSATDSRRRKYNGVAGRHRAMLLARLTYHGCNLILAAQPLHPIPTSGSPVVSHIATGRQGSTSNRTATVTGLTNSISYDFRVRATNSVGSGPYSNEDSATPVAPPPPPPTETFPGPPTNLTRRAAPPADSGLDLGSAT